VQLSPGSQATGTVTDTLTLTDNNLGVTASTQTISLTGALSLASTVTLTPSPVSPIAYGRAATSLSVTVSGSQGTPGGSVSFADGNSSLASSVALTSGVASFAAQYYAVGTHSFQATYSGDTNFSPGNSPVVSYVVSKAGSTITPPAAAVQVTAGATGSIPVTLAGQYSGAGIAVPTGAVNYSMVSSGGTTVASSTVTLASDGSAAIPVPGTLAAGAYTITLAYAGDTDYNAATAATAALQVNSTKPVVAWTQPAPITYGTALGSVLSATATSGSGTVSGTFSYTATPAGGSAAAVSSGSVLGAGTYTLTANFIPADTGIYASATDTVSIMVNPAMPAVTLSGSPNPAMVTGAVTFTANVASAAGVPAGTVTFLDGTAALGTAILTNGTASFTTASLAAGQHTVTAAYGGGANYAAAASSGVTEAIQDFSLAPAGSGGGAPPVQTASPGGMASYALVFGPVGGSTFPSAVTLSVSGLPPGATATLTPDTIPADAPLTNVSLTIQLPQTARLIEQRVPTVLWSVVLLPFAGRLSRRRKRGRLMLPILLAGAALAAAAGLSGCGSNGSGFFAHPQQTYQVVVTATSGTVSHSTTVALIVQ
jgi:hypothetical protein